MYIIITHLPTGLQTDTYHLRVVTWNMIYTYLVLIVACVVCIKSDIATNSSASDICYNYTKRVDVQFSYGVEYTDENTSQACQLRCNTDVTCIGIYFDGNIEKCYLGFSKSFYSVYPSEGVDTYTRHGCGNTPAPLCNDTFTIESDTHSQYGSGFNINTTELCEQKCLSFYTNITTNFCYGFDYDGKQSTYKCFLNFIKDYTTSTFQNVTHYKRHQCIPEGYIHIYIYIKY